MRALTIGAFLPALAAMMRDGHNVHLNRETDSMLLPALLPTGPGRPQGVLKPPRAGKTYTPNGNRECERRLRQMAKIAARALPSRDGGRIS